MRCRCPPPRAGGCRYLLRDLRVKGSVFVRSFLVALPSAVFAALFKGLHDQYFFSIGGELISEGKAFTGFSGLVGFLIVFRTSQAYTRFWSGCSATHQMRAEWVDTCSLLMSFVRVSKGCKDKIATFQGTLVRLFSMLHAVALAELEEINQEDANLDDILGFKYKLIDPDGIDEVSLRQIKNSPCKVELLYSWIQMLITQNIDDGVIQMSPPIMSRAFQTLSNGMVAFFDAIKITYCPFPFPYSQTCDFLLVIHWLLAPVVISQWVSNPYLAALFVFIQVFTLWALNHIACEIQNPFGKDANDLDGFAMQEEMNRHLLLLLADETQTLPSLSRFAIRLQGLQVEEGPAVVCNKSFMDAWNGLPCDDRPVPEPFRKIFSAASRTSGVVHMKGSGSEARESMMDTNMSVTKTGTRRRSSRMVKDTSSTDPRGSVTVEKMASVQMLPTVREEEPPVPAHLRLGKPAGPPELEHVGRESQRSTSSTTFPRDERGGPEDHAAESCFRQSVQKQADLVMQYDSAGAELQNACPTDSPRRDKI